MHPNFIQELFKEFLQKFSLIFFRMSPFVPEICSGNFFKKKLWEFLPEFFREFARDSPKHFFRSLPGVAAKITTEIPSIFLWLYHEKFLQQSRLKFFQGFFQKYFNELLHKLKKNISRNFLKYAFQKFPRFFFQKSIWEFL